MQTLTKSNSGVYNAIAKHQHGHSYTPTLRVIGEMMGISQFTVAVHLRLIIEKDRHALAPDT